MPTEQLTRPRRSIHDDPERAFARARLGTINRLVRDGMALSRASAWIDAWDVSTRELFDFRRAPDFWQLGYRYAREEHNRGYEPPVLLAADAPASPPPPPIPAALPVRVTAR